MSQETSIATPIWSQADRGLSHRKPGQGGSVVSACFCLSPKHFVAARRRRRSSSTQNSRKRTDRPTCYSSIENECLPRRSQHYRTQPCTENDQDCLPPSAGTCASPGLRWSSSAP